MIMEDRFMKLALKNAQQGVGLTYPNPAVGAVIVNNNKIIGRGYHKKAGSEHAEILAIKSVKNQKLLVGSTLYVTLEPCSHYGKTPPCTEAIVKSGIKNVVVGMKDPFKKVNGKGINKLKKSGLKVELVNKNYELSKELRSLNQPFIKFVTTGLPWVVLKVAVSLDGKMATSSGNSKWISNVLSRRNARIERSLSDAVLVGSGTVKADNPELAPHGKFKNKKLLRIIIDNDLSTNPKAKVYRDNNVLVISTVLASKKNQKKFSKAGIEFKIFDRKIINILELLKYLGKRQIQKLYVEGGAKVHGSFFDATLKDHKLVDEVIFYMAPKIIGGKNALAAFGGMGLDKVEKTIKFKRLKIERFGDDFKIKGIINNY